MSVLDHFDAVWQRVTAGNAGTAMPATGGTQDTLEIFLNDSARAWRDYSAFASRTKGETARRLSAMAEETRRGFRQLQGEYFLYTGDTYPAEDVPTPQGGLLSGLRRAYRRELGLTQRFSAAAENEQTEELAELYQRLADMTRSHAVTLREMVISILTQ